MKDRILYNWTWTRAIYLILGVLIVLKSMKGMEWSGLIIGGYFAAMGIFAFGCAAGSCYPTPFLNKTKTAQNLNTEDIDFEEIKNT